MKTLRYIAALVAILASTPAFATGNTLQCPLSNTTLVTQGGSTYSTGSTGQAASVVSGLDVLSLLEQGCVPTSLQGVTVGASGTAGTVTIYPATAAYGTLKITNAVGNVGAYDTTINLAPQGQAATITIPDPGSSTASVVLTKGTQTISGAITLSAASTALAVTNNETVGGTLGVTGVTTATGGLVSTATNDLSPTFSAGITANPVAMITKGTCSVAAVNGGTCTILTGVASRTITVTHFDIVAAGSAATCTGVLLEDNNGTPVVVATLAAATLTSAAHNVPLAATLGVGFGGGSGLTVAKNLQLIKNGSDCSTTTAFTYSVTYTIQ